MPTPVRKMGLRKNYFLPSFSGGYRTPVPATVPGGAPVGLRDPPLLGAIYVPMGRTMTLTTNFIIYKSSDTPRRRPNIRDKCTK